MSKTRLDQLTERRQQIDEQIRQLKQRENAAARKADTRKKVLIGGVIMKLVKSGEMTQKQVTELLNQHVTNPRDREFLGLKPKTGETGN